MRLRSEIVGIQDAETRTRPRLLKVLHVVDNFSAGGAAVGVLNLARATTWATSWALAEQLKHGVLSLAPSAALAGELPAGSPVRVLPPGRHGLFGFVSRLAKWVRKERFDILHVNNPGAWLDVALAARLTGRPCVQTFHGLECRVDDLPAGPPAMLRWKCFLAARMTAAVTAVGEASRAAVAQLSGLALDAVQVIPNGIDLRRFVPDPGSRSKLRAELKIEGRAPLAVHVAGLRPVKDQHTLLRAWRLVVAQSVGPAPRLLIVGNGPCHDELVSLTREMGIANQVRFLGQRADVQNVLPACDVFVLSSLTEGLSLAILEAMACGLPVVATNVGGNGELVREGVTGRLTPPGDPERLALALIDLLSNPSLASRMGLAGRRLVEEHHDLETMAARYVALYSAVGHRLSAFGRTRPLAPKPTADSRQPMADRRSPIADDSERSRS